MRRENLIYLAAPFLIALLFWDAYYAVLAVAAWTLCLLHVKGVLRVLWKTLRQPGQPAPVQSAPAAAVPEGSEPTVITLVARAPHQLLGVDHDAGTSTIFHSFYRRVKEERKDDLKLNRQGRRLTAARNEMLSRRRRQGKAATETRGPADLKGSLQALLEERPVYTGKVVQFRTLSPDALKQYHEGAEIGELGSAASCASPDSATGRGSSRFVIHCQSGRLLSSAGDGQVVFLPGTRFLILRREPWRNPDYPDSPPGFSFELVEVA